MAIITLNDAQLLAEWKKRRYNEPDMRLQASVVSDYGIDLDSILLSEARAWYRNLLVNGADHLLSVSEIHNEVTLMPGEHQMAWMIELSANVVRVLSVKLDLWCTHAVPLTRLDSPLACLQLSPYTCSGPECPVATFDGVRLRLYSCPGAVVPRLTSLRVVEIPPQGTYAMDALALNSMCND